MTNAIIYCYKQFREITLQGHFRAAMERQLNITSSTQSSSTYTFDFPEAFVAVISSFTWNTWILSPKYDYFFAFNLPNYSKWAAIQADSRRNFLISPNHINMKIGS
jgi:hypothetical protein